MEGLATWHLRKTSEWIPTTVIQLKMTRVPDSWRIIVGREGKATLSRNVLWRNLVAVLLGDILWQENENRGSL